MPRTTTGTSITGHGVWHPDNILENDELCVAFNEFVRRENAKHAAEIAAGTRQPLKTSSPEFIIKASGIIRRSVHDKTGLLDPERMCPNIPERPEDQLSVQAEYSVNAAKQALAVAGRSGEDVDLVVLGASNLQRLYPAIAIEVQNAIGARGYGSRYLARLLGRDGATQLASQAVRLGQAQCALVVAPELTTGHMNWRERDSHFIFGDASVALVVEKAETAKAGAWEILSTRMLSKWNATAIRNNYGYLDRCDPGTRTTSQALHPAGPARLQGRRADGVEVHRRSPRRSRPRPRRRRPVLDAPGQPEHERPDRQAPARPRGDPARGAADPRRVRQHRVRGLADRVHASGEDLPRAATA
jgi:3-oxoacyl-[acyl-carrier-protein] synthase III